MLPQMEAFNIDLLMLDGSGVKNLRQVKVLDIKDGMSNNFHQDGLFSIETFGKVGDAKRNRNFGYIDLRIGVFHPVLYRALGELKELYTNLIAGKAYAVFDHKLKDFVQSDVMEGETGFDFFMQHFFELKFERRPSPSREYNIKLIDKYRSKPHYDKLLVMPAGLRDYTVDANGKPSEDEINPLYRKVLYGANMIENINIATNSSYLDNMRYNLQLSVNAIYDYIVTILKGKNKLLEGDWISRKIDNSTRNVITPYVPLVNDAHSPQMVSADQTVVGIYQYMRAILPKAIQLVRDGFMSNVFSNANTPATVVDKDTLKSKQVLLPPSYYDEWMTATGLEKQMARFGIKAMRHEAITLNGDYAGLIYVGPEGYRIFQDIDDLPEGWDRRRVQFLTYAQLFYLSVFEQAPKTPCIVTRYPITGLGSVYPSYVYLKSTIKGTVRKELGADWQPTGVVANEFPTYLDSFFDSLSPASQALARMGGDFDGDTCSFTCFVTEESHKEIAVLMDSRNYYIAPDGSIVSSSSNDVIDMVLANIS